MINSSYYQPRIFPLNGDVAPAEIDRAQAIDPTVALNREKIEEIGRDGVVGYVKRSPTVAYRLTQLEYGSIEFWRKITNKGDSVNTMTLADFKTPAFDICAYLTDDDTTFRGTMWYPKLRTSGFSINIADPDAIVERSFDLVGEEAIIWQGANKYFHYVRHEASSGSDDEVDLTAYAPVADPDVDGGEPDEAKYILRVVRVRSGVSTELVVTTDYTYSNSTKILSLVSVTTADVYKIYITSSVAPAQIFVPNNTDIPALTADSCSIYLYIPASGKPSASDYLYRLQSATLDVAFEREDIKEIGNKRVVQRGIANTTVTCTLGNILEQFTIEEVLRGEVAGYGKIDVEKLTDQASLIIKFFEDSTKTTFKYGLKATGLSPTELRGGAGINAYVNAERSIEGEDLTITSDEGSLGV